MDSKNLDRLFDDSIDRLTKKTGPLLTPYALPPLAADHLLLKRSWDYFRHRLAMIEEQWTKILEAKEKEVKAILQELEATRKRNEQLEEENQSFGTIDDEFRKSKVGDYVAFKKDTERLKEQWEEERASFIKTQGDLETRFMTLEQQSKRAREEFEVREKKWKEALESSSGRLASQAEEARGRQDQMMLEAGRINEENQNLNAKIDLLRAEVERRDQAIKGLWEDIGLENNQKGLLMAQLAKSTDDLRKKEEELSLLSERFGILTKEKEALRDSWSREQAEWRELWDRQRELLERKKSVDDENVDIK